MSSSEKINQARIKKDNIRAIFQSIASSVGISRSDISKATGLSLMTVGKVADILTGEGLVTQVKPATGSAGRRAGMLAVSEKHFILSFDISCAKFRASIMSLSSRRVDSVVYTYNDSLFPEDNLIVFFRETGTLLVKHMMDKKLAGVGICIPGEYDKSSDTVISPRFDKLAGVKIAETMKRSMGFAPDRIMNGVNAAAISEIESLPLERRGCTLSITLDGGVSGCIAYEGRVVERRADFEAIICGNGRSLGRNLMESEGEEAIAMHLGYALRPIISVISPDSIFISSGERKFSDWFESMICREVGENDGDFVVIFENGKGARSDMGIASEIMNDIISTL